ncbi:MAG: phosphoribosyl-ATP diphosphatase [Candidatus Pelagibacterales bacterium]|jgi:phosphoribosyl-ATP pyrophosphohydrolase|tara:strand:- start:614 stop:922 length:309 start_codon:yes stop_codon:yes gene_type:complete
MENKVSVLIRLFETIEKRSNDDPSTSYTAQLLSDGKEKCIAKVREEALETVEAAEQEDISQIIYESADLIYHLLVMWKKFNLTPDQIYSELENREGKTGIRK